MSVWCQPGHPGRRNRRLRTGRQSGRAGALTADRAAWSVSHADLLYQLAGVSRLCIFDPVSQARQVTYNVVALETGQPKSPSGANEQH
jgi:hypothetical protein